MFRLRFRRFGVIPVTAGLTAAVISLSPVAGADTDDDDRSGTDNSSSQSAGATGGAPSSPAKSNGPRARVDANLGVNLGPGSVPRQIRDVLKGVETRVNSRLRRPNRPAGGWSDQSRPDQTASDQPERSDPSAAFPPEGAEGAPPPADQPGAPAAPGAQPPGNDGADGPAAPSVVPVWVQGGGGGGGGGSPADQVPVDVGGVAPPSGRAADDRINVIGSGGGGGSAGIPQEGQPNTPPSTPVLIIYH